MKRQHDTPDVYRASIDQPVLRETLDLIRTLVLEVAPDTVEGIEYGMLSYSGIGCLAAQKHFVALYVSPEVVDANRELIKGVDCGKSCLRFKRPEQVPVDGLRQLLMRVREKGRGGSCEA